MKGFSVKEVSKMAGVSVRTLHHYDKIDLLKPQQRTEAGYRLYGEKELVKLQQILFYRELEFPLAEIRDILDDPEFDEIRALEIHRKALSQKKKRLGDLLQTLDRTIVKLKNKEMLDFEEMYKGFDRKTAEAYDKEARERWPDTYAQSAEKLKKISKADWVTQKERQELIHRKLAALTDLSPADPGVQELIAQHHESMNFYYDCSLEIYRSLGKMYVEDERFTAFYEKLKPGMAEFMNEAIKIYCDNQ